MRRPFLPILLTGLFLLPLAAARAEGMPKNVYTAVLLDLNRVKPAQNPLLTLGKTTLNARVLDRNQRTLGKIEDIILAPDGKIQTLITQVDVSGFRETVAFDVSTYVIDPTPDTFTVSMDKTQIKQNMPQLLAAVPPAAGPEALFTLSAIKNGTIYKQDGSIVANVDDVLVDTHARQVTALLVSIASGDNRGATLAIPYEAASAKHAGAKAELTVTDEQAQVITSMAIRRQ